MPYEKKLIYGLFDVSKYTNIVNTSLIKDYAENQLDCDKSQQRLDKYNHTLWVQCMWFIGALNAVLIVIFARDVWRTDAAPDSALDGDMWYNTNNDRMYRYTANNVIDFWLDYTGPVVQYPDIF